MEGSGGIICPLRWDNQHLVLADLARILGLSVVVISNSGLGTINSTLLTISYLKVQVIPMSVLF
jgi:dethiobiotin synthetase